MVSTLEKYKALIDQRNLHDYVFVNGKGNYVMDGTEFNHNLCENNNFTEVQERIINFFYNHQVFGGIPFVAAFRHKKSRRRGSKSVKRLRKLRSKSKSRKLSPKIFRR